MTEDSDKSFVSNSRPFDVHRWSEHPEVESFVAPLWHTFNSVQNVANGGSKGRPTKRIKRDNMKVLLLDLYVCWCEDPQKYIGISSNNNHWSKGRYRALHLSATLLKVLDWLVKKGLVDKRKHYHNSINPSLSRTARYRASERLQSMFKTALFGLDDISTHENKECIVLKRGEVKDEESAENAKSISYEDAPLTVSMRERLNAYNKLLKQSHIDIHHLTMPVIKTEITKGPLKGRFRSVTVGQHNKHVRRIFSRGSWDMHGRFYGGWWQQINSELRGHIFINGNPTVEVDFKSMHVALLNAQLNAEVVFDPYKVNDDLFPELDRKVVRGWCKSLVLTAINAKDRSSAYAAFRGDAETGSIEKKLKNAQLEKLLEAFIQRNPHLQNYLCSDQGILLMNKDSLIAAEIIDTLTAKNIPVLTIHDSFIVQRHHFAQLRMAMVMASLKHCRRNLIAEQEKLDINFEKDITWGVINEKAVNTLPKYEPCEQYSKRLLRFCEANGFEQVMSNSGRGLGSRLVNVVKQKN